MSVLPVFLPPDLVIARFEEFTGATVAELRGRAQTREISRMRQECMWLLRQTTTATLAQIGGMLGGRNAMTVDEGIDRVSLRAAQDHHYRERLNDLLDVARQGSPGTTASTLCAAIGVLTDRRLSDGDARRAALRLLQGGSRG